MRREVTLEEISDGRLYDAECMSKQIVRTAKAVMTAVQGWEILSFWIRMMSVD